MIPERNKKPGVCYALTDDGIELAVVDITHPAFAPRERPEDLPAIADASLRALQRSRRMPGIVRRIMAKRSIIMRGTMQASHGFLSGLVTYLYKLGPDNLGAGYAGRLDRAMCATISPVSVRMRLRSMARLSAEALAASMAARLGRPVRMVNIAGGTAIDSLNTCILLRQEHPKLLSDCHVELRVLDLDGAGPSFGARALAALRAADGPLANGDIAFIHRSYDWADPSSLRQLLDGIEQTDVAACLSEGGLFEYGSDTEVVANLEVLRDATPADCFVVGSAVREVELLRVMRQVSQMSFKTRGRKELTALVARGGWKVERAEQGNPLYEIVRLRKR